MFYWPKMCLGCSFCNSASSLWSKSSSGQKVLWKVLLIKKFLKEFFRSKSSSKSSSSQRVSHLFRSRSGVLRVVRYSLSSPFPEPSLHSFTLPFTLSFPSLVDATLLPVSFWLFRIVFASSLRRDLSQTLVRRGNVADRLGHIGRPLDHPRCSCLRKSLAVRDAFSFCSSNRLFSAWSPLANKDNFGLPWPQKSPRYWNILWNILLVKIKIWLWFMALVSELDYWLLLFV